MVGKAAGHRKVAAKYVLLAEQAMGVALAHLEAIDSDQARELVISVKYARDRIRAVVVA